MKVQLHEVKSNIVKFAEIKKAGLMDMPLKKDGWQFSWKSLFNTVGADFYKLVLEDSQDTNQGIAMFSLMNEEMVFMNNIEVAPHNYGKNGQYDKVAGCLIAYGCLLSFENGKGNYLGYLTFESKTELIPYYQKAYGATLAMGHKMFIDPVMGLKLMEKYLNFKKWKQ